MVPIPPRAGRSRLSRRRPDKDLAEIKASGDVLTHNRGIANQVHVEKAVDCARFADGDRLDIPEPYLLTSLRLVPSVIGDMAASAIAKAT
jgi:hypothetical protein